MFGVCVCLCVHVCMRACKCVLVSVGGRNICLLAASFPQVLSNGDKGMACGKIDRRMLCLFRLVHRLQPHHHSEEERESEGEKERNLPEESGD